MGDDGLHEVWTTRREVDGDRRAGACTDHDGGRGLQVFQNGGGVAGVRRNQANGFPAGSGVAPAVVGNHSSDPRELFGERGRQVEALVPAGGIRRIGTPLPASS
jgi:hypothetical protein